MEVLGNLPGEAAAIADKNFPPGVEGLVHLGLHVKAKGAGDTGAPQLHLHTGGGEVALQRLLVFALLVLLLGEDVVNQPVIVLQLHRPLVVLPP